MAKNLTEIDMWIEILKPLKNIIKKYIPMTKEKDTKKILTEVLKKIKPNIKQKEQLEKLSKKTLDLVNKEAEKVQAKTILAGSLTRNTWLPNKNEFDVFIIFPKDLPLEKMENIAFEIGKGVIEKLGGKWRIEYAQHPYVRGTIKEVEVDIVPCYAVDSTEKIESAVDRTPFHVAYLSKNLPRELADEVRLVKQFLKANGIYGADAKIEGFSGYVCELLVINYGTFESIMKAVQKWKPKEIIDIKGYWKKEDYHKLKRKFKDEILIIIDPVDKNRNTCAAVSAQSFYKFKNVATQFLEKPSTEIFFIREIKPLTKTEFKTYMGMRGTKLVGVKFKPPDTVTDILWPQLRKTTKRLESILQEYEFFVLRSGCWTDEKRLAIILLEMQVWSLPKVDKLVGPWVFDEKNAKKFIEKHSEAMVGPFIEDNNWCVEVRRPWTKAKGKLFDTLSVDLETLKAKGIPNYIAKSIENRFTIIDEKRIGDMVGRNKEFGIFLRKYFEKNI